MTTKVNGRYVCPYNKSHFVDWLKLPNHLVRCRNNNPALADKIQICPFNRCHHVPKEELEEHIRNCKEAHWFQHLSYKPDPSSERASLRPRLNPDIVVEQRRECLSDNAHEPKNTIGTPVACPSAHKSSVASTNHAIELQKWSDEAEHNVHRKLLEKSFLTENSPEARVQNQRNLDDLDEWFVE